METHTHVHTHVMSTEGHTCTRQPHTHTHKHTQPHCCVFYMVCIDWLVWAGPFRTLTLTSFTLHHPSHMSGEAREHNLHCVKITVTLITHPTLPTPPPLSTLPPSFPTSLPPSISYLTGKPIIHAHTSCGFCFVVTGSVG